MFPQNRDRPTHHALVCCFDPATGTPSAVIDGTYLTAARTAAGSAVATRLLARPGASRVLGAGRGAIGRRGVRRREWLLPGTHVNSVGYNTGGDGEVDPATIREALVVVESRAAALAPPPAGAVELLRAVDARAIDASGIVEIGQIAAGTVPGRAGDTQLTLYKSVGVAAQDTAAAALVLAAARQRGAGTHVTM